jgi:hypothetical protein
LYLYFPFHFHCYLFMYIPRDEEEFRSMIISTTYTIYTRDSLLPYPVLLVHIAFLSRTITTTEVSSPVHIIIYSTYNLYHTYSLDLRYAINTVELSQRLSLDLRSQKVMSPAHFVFQKTETTSR